MIQKPRTAIKPPFEKKKTSFNEVLRIFNSQKDGGFKSFDEFLNAKHFTGKYKVGDLVVLEHNENTENYGWKHEVVYKVIGLDNGHYRLVHMSPPVAISCILNHDILKTRIGTSCSLTVDFLEHNSRKLF